MWWMKPIPPVSFRINRKTPLHVFEGDCVPVFSRNPMRLTAIAMAIPASVTVSMGEETSGVFSVIFLVRAEVRS